MKRLTTEEVLKEKRTHDPDSVTELSLTSKALSDVSCLSEFKNLEKLDLRFNSLTSLEGLKSCSNLKWLSVVQNKLESLKGVEGLKKLTVLNAGKNKLKSMDEVKSLLSLRALILNDNEISSICKLDQLTDLNTLVLSRNPIREIGDSLVKVKSITKISLSNCQIKAIDSSLKSCTELKELRLSHNEIEALPSDLAYNKKLQNFDLGNNSIARWSDLKILSSLVNLENLNLQGNSVAEKDQIAKKVKKLLPNLHIFNSKPIEKSTTNAKDRKVVDDDKKEIERDSTGGEDSKQHTPNSTADLNVEKESKQKRKKTNNLVAEKEPVDNEDEKSTKKKSKRKPKDEQGDLDAIDDGETSFFELYAAKGANNPENINEKKGSINKAAQDLNEVSGLVTYPAKRKKIKNKNISGTTLEPSPTVEVGMGGLSTWDD